MDQAIKCCEIVILNYGTLSSTYTHRKYQFESDILSSRPQLGDASRCCVHWGRVVKSCNNISRVDESHDI